MITILLSIFTALFAITTTALGVLWLQDKKKLKKFAAIIDLEKHAQGIKTEAESKAKELEKTNGEIGKQKQVYQKYVEVVGVIKSVAEAQQKLNSIKTEISEASKILATGQSAIEFGQKLAHVKEQLAKYQEAIGPTQSQPRLMAKNSLSRLTRRVRLLTLRLKFSLSNSLTMPGARNGQAVQQNAVRNNHGP